MLSKALQVHFVHDGSSRCDVWRFVALPVIRTRIDDYAFHGCGEIISRAASALSVVVLGNDYASAIWVQQTFLGVEPQSIFRVEWSVSSICVNLSRRGVRDEHMPIMVSTVCVWIDLDHAC